MAKKINLNILQIMKFGSHLGNASNRITSSSKPYVTGTRNSISILDTNIMVSSLRRVIFFSKKITLKRASFLLCNSLDDRISKNMSRNVAQSTIFVKANKIIVPGAVTNSQLFKKRFFKNKTSMSKIKTSIKNSLAATCSANKLVRNRLSPSSSVRPGRAGHVRKTYSLPSALFMLGLETPLGYYSVLNSRKKGLVSISFLDTHNAQGITNYGCLMNNKSSSSINFLIKVLKNIDFKHNYPTL